MKRGIAVLVSLSALVSVGYFTASKWSIRHETLTFNDRARGNRPVAVGIAVRRDKEMQANAGMIKLPVADPQPWQHRQIHRVLFSGERLCRPRLYGDQHPA
jgi:hypothetical protein